MASHDTEALAHRWHLDMVQGGDLDLAKDVLSPDVVIHANGTELRGHDGARQLVTALQAALPDLRITHDEAIMSGNSVAIRWTADATHQGDYFGIPGNGQQVHFEGVDFFHVVDGKLSEIWIAYDNLGAFQRSGALSG